MKHPAELQHAYVLHSRPYRETSLIVDFLVPEHGRISAVARGARRAKSPVRSQLQPFVRLLVSWYGRGELKTLKVLENDGQSMRLQGRALFSGLYLNELLVRLLKVEEPCEQLFADYQQAIAQLAVQQPIESVLRRFEQCLLHALGYGLTFPAASTAAREEAEMYYYSPDSQWVLLASQMLPEQRGRCFQASDLAAIANNNYSQAEVLRSAKRLMRLALTPLLGDRPLHSKDLFIQQ